MPAQRYAFGEYTLDLGRGALLRAGVDVRLRPKSYEVLRFLVERAGRLVTKDELLDAVWPRVVVTEGSITQCLVDIRRAIGDESQAIVRTIPRRGYLFDAQVVASEGHVAAQPAASAPDPAAALAGDPGREVPERSTAPHAGGGIAPPSASSTATTRARRRLGVAAIVVAGATFALWLGLGRRDSPAPAATATLASGTTAIRAPPNSIAVLPFVNMSAEPDQEYFSDGVSEEILNLLARTPGLHVIARTSSFSFKGRQADVAEIASKLNVAYVVEGSVRKSGGRLRITAQLIDAATSSHLWSDTYDRDAQDAFAVQIDIATKVAEALEATLTTDRLADGSMPPSAEAHENFLRARYFYHRRAPGDLELARRYYEETLRIDPRYARAWSGLAGVYGVEFSEGTIPVEVGLEKRRAAVEKALALDPNLAEAHARAAVHFWETGDGKRSAEHATRAYSLDRDEPLVLAHYCTLLAWHERYEDALKLERRIIELDPVSLAARVNYGNTLIAAGRLEEARDEYLRTVELNPDWRPAADVELARILILQQRYAEALESIGQWSPGDDQDAGLALVYYAIGRRREADAAVERLRAATGPGPAVRLAEIQARRGDRDAAFEWIDEAYDRIGPRPWLSAEWQWLMPLRFSPFLQPLHADPRWPASLARGLPPGTEMVLRALPERFVVEGTLAR
jgi:TolB-like protein/DNA-binding winged helix-turn-helix (wHTH) protein/Tfp pilus assembly protein PilF